VQQQYLSLLIDWSSKVQTEAAILYSICRWQKHWSKRDAAEPATAALAPEERIRIVRNYLT
jgi:hypothetical protein